MLGRLERDAATRRRRHGRVARPGVERDPDDDHGEFPLSESAAERFEALADAATATHRV